MDLKELRYFRAIAEWGTLSKAAAHLHVAQPALSRQMQKLERSLGVDLMRRTSKGVTMTPAGLALLQRTIQLEHDLAETRREVSNFSKGLSGTIHFAVQYPLSTLLMPSLFKAYRGAYPDVAIHVVEGYSSDIVASLLAERLDVAVLDPPTHEHVDLTVLPLWVDELALFGPASAAKLPLFLGTNMSLQDAATLPLIMPSQSSSLRRLVECTFMKHHLKLHPVLEADGQLLNIEMVKAGYGYTIFPKGPFAVLAEQNGLISRNLTPTILRTTALVTRTALLEDRKVAPFIKMIKELVPILIGSGSCGSARKYAATP